MTSFDKCDWKERERRHLFWPFQTIDGICGCCIRFRRIGRRCLGGIFALHHDDPVRTFFCKNATAEKFIILGIKFSYCYMLCCRAEFDFSANREFDKFSLRHDLSVKISFTDKLLTVQSSSVRRFQCPRLVKRHCGKRIMPLAYLLVTVSNGNSRSRLHSHTG